jgi:hypothetical protein
MGRRYIGIDINPAYIKLAQERIRDAPGHEPLLLIGRAKYPGREELAEMAAADARRHERQGRGRKEAQTQDLRALTHDQVDGFTILGLPTRGIRSGNCARRK